MRDDVTIKASVRSDSIIGAAKALMVDNNGCSVLENSET